MKFLKKMTAIVTAVTMIAVGNIGILPRDAVEDFMLSVRAADSDIVASGECGAQGDNLTWTLDSEGTLTISGEGEMMDFEDMSVHTFHHNTPWIGYYICNIVIDEDVASISNGAFSYCDNLTSIIIPDSVTSIGDHAFSYCDNLTSITIPDSVTSIGSGAFETTPWLEGKRTENPIVVINGILIEGLTCEGDIVIPDSVTSIGDRAFSYCDNLTSITIPESVTSIGDYAFSSCASLTSITIPNSVTSIGDHAFSYCDNLTSITIPDSVTSIGDYAFSSCASLTSITIPNSVTSIGDYAFSSCASLTSITIPNSVTSIGDHAFSYCDNLTSITIPDSVTSIGSGAFETTPWLEGKRTENPIVVINGILIEGLTCEGDIVIPDSVTSIGDRAFSYCDNLTSITIPESITSIGNDAFYYCDNLTSITIPDSVTSIGNSAFSSCASLTSITIPESVTSIGNDAFYSCYSLTSIKVDSKNKHYVSENGVLFGKDKSLLIQYPMGKTAGEYTIPDSVTIIRNSAFSGCSSLTSITIPTSVTSIGEYVFSGCSSLTSITIPTSVTSIGEYAFSHCGCLTSITIPESVTSIGIAAFSHCGSLTSIIIPESVTNIGTSAFDGTLWLDEKRKENSLVIVNGILIDGTTCEDDIVIPNSVTSIGNSAFSDCANLTSISIPDSVTSIGDSAFYGCTNLTSIEIPNDVKRIEGATFIGCRSLHSIIIPDSVKIIEEYAFFCCDNLFNIYYYGNENLWNNITMLPIGNGPLISENITIHYNFKLPDSEKQSVYQFFNMPLSWERAKEYCESLNGHLAVISSAEEQSIIEEQIPNISKNCYWIGAYLENDEWKWVTDEPFEYENWGENLPDNHQGIEKYAHIYAKDNTDESSARLKGEWNDCGLIDKTTPSYNFYSNHNFGFICEWEDESLVPDDSEIDSKIYGYLDILEYNPFYFGSTDTIEILHEYKEMAKADPQVETYHFWKNLSNSIDGDVNEDEYNEKMTVEAILAEIFLNKELNDAFTKSAEQSAIEAQNMFLTVLTDNAESFGIGEEHIGYIESISSSTDALLENKKIVSVLESVKPEKVPELFNKLGEYTKKFGELSDAIGFFQICYEGYNEGVESAAQLYNLYIACVSYHTSNMEFRKAVSLMSASVEEEIAKYTGNDDFSHRMRRVGKLYLDYYTVMLDESMAAYDDFASSITSNTLLGTGTELFVFSIKAIVSIVFPELTAAEFVLDIGVSIWEATSDINERSLERDKLLNMILFYDSFSNALYSENGFYGMLKENPTEESYKTLVIGIKMHTITENMLIDYAINYSHMLKRALSDWKRQFVLISQTDYVKPVFKARYPQVNVKGETVTRCWKTLNQDMCDDDIQLLKLKKVYIDNDGFDSIKNICNLSESEAKELGKKYIDYYFLSQELSLYSIFCPVNILIKNGDEIVAIVENDIVTYNNGEIFIDIYKESNYENAYKYIKLPKGYNLEITGYADGTMSFEKAIIENGSVIELSNIEKIPVTAGSVYKEVIEGNKTIALECDLDDDGIVDQIVDAKEAEVALYGDVDEDGKVAASDAAMTLVEYAILSSGTASFTEEQFTACDVNEDNKIGADDAANILMFYTYLSGGGTEKDMKKWFSMQN